MNNLIKKIVCFALLVGASSVGAATFTVNTDYAIDSGEGNGVGSDAINISGTVTTDGTDAVTAINLTFSSPSKDDVAVTGITFATGTAVSGGGILTFDGGSFLFAGANGTDLTYSDPGSNLVIQHQDTDGSSATNEHNPAGAETSFTMTVVPEPHEYAMMAGLGLLGFGVWRRKSMQVA